MSMARDEVIRIKVSPVIKTKFQTYADALGLGESALGAFIIGNYILQQEKILGPMLERLSNTADEKVREMLSEQITLATELDKQ